MGHSFDKKNLAAGVKEMRSVAKRLLAWADDLEKAGKNEEEKEAPAPKAPPKLDEVKAFLTKKCAAGYSAQVQALIASFGAKTLSGVPEGSLGALLDAALLLGEEGEDANAG